jgi:hypothetical protein
MLFRWELRLRPSLRLRSIGFPPSLALRQDVKAECAAAALMRHGYKKPVGSGMLFNIGDRRADRIADSNERNHAQQSDGNVDDPSSHGAEFPLKR